MSPGRFFKLIATAKLPDNLVQGIPPVLWIADEVSTPADLGSEVALEGKCCDSGERVALASSHAPGQFSTHFDIDSTIAGILREDYHAGFEPTAEMRLPFNYSKLPCWVKAVGRRLRSGSIAQAPAIAFPDHGQPYVVPWLERLRALAPQLGNSGAETVLPRAALAQPCQIAWPPGKRAALVITHDVDTDWVFRHIDWLERICQLEARYDLRGAWYCVPRNSRGRAAERGIQRLWELGCEVGCHGYNHDAKFPLTSGKAFAQRMDCVRRFRDRWRLRGFRSEWLYRTPQFLQAIAGEFAYDSSAPAVNPLFSRRTNNGCAACAPFRTHGGLWELPLSVPMDEDRHLLGHDEATFWNDLATRAEAVIEFGGLVVLTLHPQPHQMANAPTLARVEALLDRVATRSDLWLTRPADVVDWLNSAGERNGRHEPA